MRTHGWLRSHSSAVLQQQRVPMAVAAAQLPRSHSSSGRALLPARWPPRCCWAATMCANAE